MGLTKTGVADLKPQSKDVFAWDDDVPGFGVRVKPSGRKTYVIRYRTLAGTSRLHTLGRVSDLDPRQAREIARRLFVDIRQGLDPSAERKRTRGTITAQELYDLWIELHVRTHCKKSYERVAKGLWNNHIKPSIGNRKISEIERVDILDIHTKLRAHPSTANSALSVISSMFVLAVDRGLAETNPVRNIKWFRVPKRAYVLSPEEIRRLVEALDDQSVFPQFALLIRLLLLTGCRLTEIMHARVEWIDWERKLLCLPDTKTGAREIALSEPAMSLLSAVKNREWIVPGRYTGHWKHVTSSWDRVKALAGLPDVVRIHDLRHTVGSLSHAAGLTQKEIAIQLGHKRLSTTERYLTGFRGDHHDIAGKVAAVIGG